jgi:hypothetical protein
MMWPETIGGMVGMTLAILTILTIVLGVVIRLARQHIRVAVVKEVSSEVEAAMAHVVELLSLKLDTIRINQEENSAALGRVHELEVTIKNGLSAQVKEIKHQVNQLVNFHMGTDHEEQDDSSS